MLRKQPYTAERGAALLQARRLVIHRFSITEDQWYETMLDTGCRFAEHFCRQFNNKVDMINEILRQKPANEDSCNGFWTWWRFQFMQDDELFIKSQAYYEYISSYTDLKSALVGNKELESQLLNTMYHQ